MSCTDNTESVTLLISDDGTLTAEVNLSARAENAIVEETDGLYVPSIAVPTGAMIPYGAAAAPAGWLICDGSAVSRSTYATLFGILGTAFGSGDGTTTFNVPDFRDRVPVGAIAGGNTAIGANEGVAAAHRFATRHRATVTDPGHTHTGNAFNHSYAAGGSATNDFGGVPNNPNAYTTNAATTGITVGQNTNDPLDVVAYNGVNIIVKT